MLGGYYLRDFWKRVIDQCAQRELKEETGIQVPYMSHFANYSDPNRDTRHQVISVAYLAVHPSGKLRIRANSDVFDVNWFDVKDLPDLCFDHNKICSDGIKYSRLLIERKPSLAFAFHKVGFSLTELQQTFAAMRHTNNGMSLIHITDPTRPPLISSMPSSA